MTGNGSSIIDSFMVLTTGNAKLIRKTFKQLTFFAVLFGALLGCVARPSSEVGKRYLWPPSADDAKIEYVAFYTSIDDLRQGQDGWLREAVFGKERPQPLFQRPHAIDARFGRVAVTDTILRKVLLLDMAGQRLEVIGEASEKSKKGLTTPTGVAIVSPEEVWVVDSLLAEIRRFAVDGRALGSFGRDQLTRPTAIAFDHQNQRAVVVDTPNHRLAVFSAAGDFLHYLGERGEGPGQFNFPLDADFGPDGELFVLDALNARAQRFHWDGEQYRYKNHFGERGTAAGSFQIPKALAVTPSGHIYVTDSLSNKVVVFDRDGQFLLSFGGKFVSTDGSVSPGGLNLPAGIAADEQDRIWVVDSLNRVVHQFQYLSEAYLQKHPISDWQVFAPQLINRSRQFQDKSAVEVLPENPANKNRNSGGAAVFE